MPKILFQYIKCYCLSKVGTVKDTPISLFQYIKCYCLSYNRYRVEHCLIFISIHQMLLFI